MKPLDRRVVRTRRMLREALVALILEQGYDSITVQNITDRADLRRATFYLHYDTKDGLLLATLEATFEELTGQIEALTSNDALAHKNSPEAYRLTFQHVADHSELYRAIFEGQAAARVSRYVQTHLAAYFRRHLTLESPPTVPLDVLANYVAGTEIALIIWWLENNQPYPVEQMAALTHRLLWGGIRAGLLDTFPPPAPDQIGSDEEQRQRHPVDVEERTDEHPHS